MLREQIVRLVDASEPPVRTVVLNAEGMVDMDITGAETLAAILDDLDERGVRLAMARVRSAVRTTMQRLGVEERLGADNIHLDVRAAVRAAGGSPTIPGQ